MNADTSKTTKVRTPRQRFWLLMKIMLLITSLGIGGVYAILIRSGEPFHLHFFIAIGLGVFFSLMLAGLLMGLVFLSNRSGHDAQIGADDDWKDEA